MSGRVYTGCSRGSGWIAWIRLYKVLSLFLDIMASPVATSTVYENGCGRVKRGSTGSMEGFGICSASVDHGQKRTELNIKTFDGRREEKTIHCLLDASGCCWSISNRMVQDSGLQSILVWIFCQLCE